MSKTRDLDAAKDRLVDSISVARDATKTAVRDEIAPAVAAAVGAAREASGPIAAEAASRASDAASRATDAAKSLLASDAAARAMDSAKSLSSSDTAKALSKRKAKAARAVKSNDTVNRALRRDTGGRKRWAILALAAGAAVGLLAKGKKKSAPANAYPAPVSTPPAPSEAPIQAASVDLPIEEPTGGQSTGKPKS